MKATIEYKDDFLYVVEEKEGATGAKKWLPVRRADCAEAQTLQGRPVTSINLQEGIYVDEEGNVYQLADKGETRSVAVEHLPGTRKTGLEVLLEASLKGGGQTNGKNSGAKRLLKKNRSRARKQQASQNGSANPEARPAESICCHRDERFDF